MSHRSFARLLPLGTLIALATLASGGASPAQGSSFTVNATHDAVDAAPGDGVCADAGGACTLRAAAMETNALAGADAISLPAGNYSLSIPGAGENASATGDIDVADDLTITGAGRDKTAIDGARVDRVFHVVGPVTVTIEAVSIKDGLARRSAAPSLLSCDSNGDGGGICNEGELILSRSSVVSNEGGSGGGVFSGVGSRLTVDLSRVNLNRATGVPIPDNPGQGGGIDSYGALSASHIEVAGNTAATFGGGLATRGISSVVASTVSGNTSGNVGGGIVVGFGSTITLTNATVSGNSAGATGGGLENQGEVVLRSSTVADNNAAGGGGFNTFGGRQTFVNTIVAGNTSADCGLVTQYPPVSQGHNLDSDGTCGFTGPGDFTTAEPGLLPLADNGGPTRTHALVQGGCPTGACINASPAIDAGESSACPSTDQRGEPRPFDSDGDGIGECDIGAYELQVTCASSCGVGPGSPTAPATTLPAGGGAPGNTGTPLEDAAAIALPLVALALVFARRAWPRYSP